MTIKCQLFIQMLAGFSFACGAMVTLRQPSYAQDRNKFFCGLSNGQPATIVRTSRGNIPMIRWEDDSFPSPWTPQRRCEEISERFQRFYDNGTLNFLKAGKFKGQPVLCVAGYKGGPCLTNGVLVTLKANANPQLTLQRLQDRRALAAGRPIHLSGSELISQVNGETYFNIKNFLGEGERSTSDASEPPLGPVWEW